MSDVPQERDGRDSSARQSSSWSAVISLIVSLIMAAGIIVGLISWALNSARDAKDAQASYVKLSEFVGVQVTELKASISTLSTDLKQQIQYLPDQRAELAQDAKRLDNGDTDRSRLDQRTTTLENDYYRLNSDLSQIKAASAAPLPNDHKRVR